MGRRCPCLGGGEGRVSPASPGPKSGLCARACLRLGRRQWLLAWNDRVARQRPGIARQLVRRLPEDPAREEADVVGVEADLRGLGVVLLRGGKERLGLVRELASRGGGDEGNDAECVEE